MTFKLSILLIPYLLFLLLWLIFSLVAVYHMIKFGFKNFTTFFTTFIFVAVSLALLAVSYSFLIQIDWNASVSIFKGAFDGSQIF
ncbi:hypothetical protein L6267_01610 [Candidatus Parcubacteria bacterium]|nr:hypothetical protein [Candidatus Parcubacteria bacterium]